MGRKIEKMIDKESTFNPEHSLLELFSDVFPEDIYKIFEKHKLFELIKNESPKAWQQLTMANTKVLIKEGALKKSKKNSAGYVWCSNEKINN